MHVLHIPVHQQLERAKFIVNFFELRFVLFDADLHDVEGFGVLLQQSRSLHRNLLSHLLALREILKSIVYFRNFVADVLSSFCEGIDHLVDSPLIDVDSVSQT